MFERKLKFLSVDDLRKELEKSIEPGLWGIWGVAQYKTIQDLWQEYVDGESEFIRDGEGVVRKTKTVFARIRYTNAGADYELKESWQDKGDGRKISRELPGSAGEKMIKGEKEKQTLERLFEEELNNMQLSREGMKINRIKKWKEKELARSYPGLVSRATDSLWEVTLKPDQGTPRDFEITERGRTTHFSWARRAK